MDPKNQRTYTGHSGQMAVMAELLARGCNVAIPEIDVGEDVFAFQDGEPAVDRIQVKTANARKRKRQSDEYSAKFSVPLAQLRNLETPELYYVFAIRVKDLWTDFVVISRRDLYTLHENENLGSRNEKRGELRLEFRCGPGSLRCGEQDLSDYRNAWQHLPVLKPAHTFGAAR